MKNKPGVMIYFDLIPALKMLGEKEIGQLFLAIMEYGQSGIEPQLTGKAEILWPMVRFRLSSDDIRYQQTVLKRKYAAYTRWQRNQGKEPQSFDLWLASKGDRIELCEELL